MREAARGWGLLRPGMRVMAVLVLLAAAGTAGYVLIEGWGVGDALYMTVITLSTVGYGEVHPLSAAGRAFTIILIVSGVGAFTYLITTLSQYVAGGVFTGRFWRRRMQRAIDALTGHYIVCGFGRVGRQVVDDLRARGYDCVIVERDEATLGHGQKLPLHLIGDATDDDVLRRAGLERAGGVVAAAGDDATNLFVTMSARTLNGRVRIVARANVPTNEAKLARAGATHVVSPYAIGGRRIATQLVSPGVGDFLDLVMGTEQGELWLEEVTIAPTSRLAGQAILDAVPRAVHGVNIVAVRRGPRGDFISNPPPELVLAAGDLLIALGTRDQLTRLAERAAGLDDGGGAKERP